MINCVWYNGAFGNWDNGLMAEIFNSRQDVFIQHNTKDNPVFERAIVLINGKPEVESVRTYLEKINEAYVFLLSDEDGFFNWKDAVPERHELFTQYYTAIGKSEIKNRILLGAPNRVKDYTINTHLPKKYLWSFIGQSQNPFRQQCVEVLKTLPDGYLHVTDLFGGEGETGVTYQKYLDTLCQSKFAICPSGSMSADSFRVYEAIECGAIPITNTRCPRDKHEFNYWAEVYPSNELNYIFEWDKKLLEWILEKDYLPEHLLWWDRYKKQLTDKLISIANG